MRHIITKLRTYDVSNNNSKAFFIRYPAPLNIGYLWNFGSMACLFMVVQIIIGLLMMLYYTQHTLVSIVSVDSIITNINSGWLIRYIHANCASILFFFLYLHSFRSLLFIRHSHIYDVYNTSSKLRLSCAQSYLKVHLVCICIVLMICVSCIVVFPYAIHAAEIAGIPSKEAILNKINCLERLECILREAIDIKDNAILRAKLYEAAHWQYFAKNTAAGYSQQHTDALDPWYQEQFALIRLKEDSIRELLSRLVRRSDIAFFELWKGMVLDASVDIELDKLSAKCKERILLRYVDAQSYTSIAKNVVALNARIVNENVAHVNNVPALIAKQQKINEMLEYLGFSERVVLSVK